MPLLLAAALPDFGAARAAPRLAELCGRWERDLAPRLAPAQLAHCRRFGQGGSAPRARASRLLARLLALRALPGSATLEMDERGRPRVAGAPGWRVAFSHSGAAAFCLVLTPGETAGRPAGYSAVDAEPADGMPSTDRGFAAPAPTPQAGLRRWLLAEALFKALGGAPESWQAAARAAHDGARQGAGYCTLAGARLSWRFVVAPGHALCVALPGDAPFPVDLRWLTWQSFLS
ncbi:MAG: hypothetical protein HDR50_01710 [Desulfovibrio sp.]|uniref:hypothetical protein n=1 Tax=Desulfovibrio sp. TaxID=885 RepID=UPI001A70D0C8|nr:hypothetical protein [Desulfovibrio sp.]MBD5416401.1 hypothetical protein [Desulfovibrio sp.]